MRRDAERREVEKELKKLFEKSLKKYLTNANGCANIVRHSREGTQERVGKRDTDLEN